ncbi:hypothetical protein [Solibacillus sp. FSL H8-0538]|uniref:hypothetical protein n=1 Tax=Solibacillus sp. FSL H8-0538 TaxID=2921400 RepID=UPI0030F7B85E
MLNEIQSLIHRQIILNLTIRTFEHERNQLTTFKMQRAFATWFDVKIKELQQDLITTKSELGKLGVKIQSDRVDGEVTEYAVLVRGNADTRRYMNVALRNWVEEETNRLLGMPYHTPEDRK